MTHTLDSHFAFIQQRMPAWLQRATCAQRRELRQQLLASHRANRALAHALAEVKAVDRFCQPLLDAALARWYPAHSLPAGNQRWLLDETTRHIGTWLEAALQNLASDAQVKLYASRDATLPWTLDSQRFVRGVRSLDLGRRYQDHLRDHLGTDTFHRLLLRQDRAAFCVELNLARLQGRIDSRGQAMGEAVLAGANALPHPGGERRLECGFISLFGIAMDGPMLIRLAPEDRQEPCLLYLPGHPRVPLQQYRSLRAVGGALTRWLWQAEERAFFMRHASQALQPLLALRLRQTLYPHYPYRQIHDQPPVLEKDQSIGWLEQVFPSPKAVWQATLDKNARIPLTFTPWSGDYFATRARLRVQRRLADAASIAVPVAEHDHAAMLARLEGWLGIGLTVLNVASLFVPGLAEIMLVVGGAQLVDEFLDGVHSAGEGETEQAIMHLFAFFENLAQFAALGAAAHLMAPPGILHDWVNVGEPGQQRLWHGHATPFSRPRPWPQGEAPGPAGLHHAGGTQWVEMDGKAYPLAPADTGLRRVQSAKGHQYQPGLLGNGQGSWLMAHERPLAWAEDALLRRLTPGSTQRDVRALQLALRCSGYDAAAIRRVVSDHRPLPALLGDSLEAFGISAPAPLATGAEDALLARDFPGLSPRARGEILAQASPRDLARLRDHARLPLAVAERARLYLRDARINRALAHLALDQTSSADRDALIFAALERLPGWSGEVRLELRDAQRQGPLLHTTGETGRPMKTLVRDARGYTPYDETGQALNGRSSLYQAILHALPDSARSTLALPINAPETLRNAVFEQATFDRPRLAQDLGLPTLRPFFRAPERLPGDRRLGYRLSGRPRGRMTEDECFDQLFPGNQTSDRQALRQRLRHQAGSAPGAFARLLEELRVQYQQLDAALQAWVEEPGALPSEQWQARRVARDFVGQQIRAAWRWENDGAGASLDAVSLELEGEQIGPLPHLPVCLPQVRQLSISGLPITASDSLDNFLRTFPRVHTLDLSENGLPGLPASVGDLFELHTLDLSENLLNLTGDTQLATLLRLQRLERLNLTNALEEDLPPALLERMAALPALRFVQLEHNYLRFTHEHFQALRRWPALRYLELGNNEITLTLESRAALNELNQLCLLSLRHNPLELAPDLTQWQRLEQLDLEHTSISEWPAGLLSLLDQQPLALRELDLSRNELIDIPDLHHTAFARQLRAGNHGLTYDFEGNPLSDLAQQRLQEAGLATPMEVDGIVDWSEGWPASLRSQVTATRQDPEWRGLYTLFDRVTASLEFQNSPWALRQRMRHTLQTLLPGAEEPAGWGRAQLHRQVSELLDDAAQGCVDQASLLFQQVETLTQLWEAVAHAAPGASHEQVAVDSATSLYRQGLLDQRVGALYQARVARRQALSSDDAPRRESAPPLQADDDISDTTLGDPNFGLDELEIALYARIRLASRLGLPTQPAGMYFAYLAQLGEAALQRLAAGVESDFNLAGLNGWLGEQTFWHGWLERLYPDAFEAQARQWEGASLYFDTLGTHGPDGQPYTGPAVPHDYVRALEHELGDIPGLRWREDGVLQRIDVMSGRYANEDGIYQRAAQLLLSSRQAARRRLYLQLTEALTTAHLAAPLSAEH